MRAEMVINPVAPMPVEGHCKSLSDARASRRRDRRTIATNCLRWIAHGRMRLDSEDTTASSGPSLGRDS
jgi:hypothetical protein